MSQIRTDARLLFCSPEATFNVLPIMTADHALEFISADFGPAQKDRTEHRADRTGTRSPSLGMTHGGMDPVTGSISRSFAPQTTTAMDTHELMTEVLGTLATSTYSIKAEPLGPLSFVQADTDRRFVEGLCGVVPTQYVVNCPATGRVIETFELKAARHWSIAQSTLNTTLVQAATTIVMDNPGNFSNAFGVAILLETEEILLSATEADWDFSTPGQVTVSNITRAYNSTSDVLHTVVSHPADTLTIYGAVPVTKTTAGNPIGEHQVSITWDGASHDVSTATLSIATGRDLQEPALGSRFSLGVTSGRLEVTFDFNLLLDVGTPGTHLDDMDAELIGDAVNNEEGAFGLVIGTVASAIGTWAVPKAELMTVQTEDPTQGPLTGAISGTGYGASGNDDASLVIS